MAQQHMAKKVKEAAELSDQVNEKKVAIGRLEEEVRQAKAIASEARNMVESHNQQEKQLQEQINNWEQKYFTIYDQWKESEANNKELKKLEEKYQQMQDLLKSLGSFVGTSEMPPQPPKQPKKPKNQAPKQEENVQDLFSMKTTRTPTKENLFD